MRNSRRTFLKTSALGLAAVGAGVTAASAETAEPAAVVSNIENTQPGSEIAIWSTDAKQRFAAGSPIQWHPAPPPLPDPPPGVEPVVLLCVFQNPRFKGCVDLPRELLDLLVGVVILRR